LNNLVPEPSGLEVNRVGDRKVEGNTMIKTTTQTKVALATLGVMVASTAACVSTAHAGSKGRRNTTIGLGAVTAYGLLKKNKTVAIAGAVGTAYAYSRYRKAKKAEDRNNRYRSARRYR
jgi:hypothetical protein